MSKVPLISLFLHNGREERGRMLHLERRMGAGKPPASWRLLPCLSLSFRAAGLRDYMMSLLLSVFVFFLCYLIALLLSFSWLFSLMLSGFCLWGQKHLHSPPKAYSVIQDLQRGHHDHFPMHCGMDYWLSFIAWVSLWEPAKLLFFGDIFCCSTYFSSHHIWVG